MSKRIFSPVPVLLLALSFLIVGCGTIAPPVPTATPNPTPAAAPTVAPTAAASPTVPALPTIAPLATPTSAPPTVATPTVAAGAACTNIANFVADVTVPDNTTVTPGQTFTKTWRIRNTGTCTWGAGYTFAFVRGEAMTTSTTVEVPSTAPNATADLSVPMTAPATAGSNQGFWQLKASNGRAFGPEVWVLVRVATAAAAPSLTPAPSGACTNVATFVSDVTVPDNTTFAPGQAFNKIWRMRNAGTCTWDSSYTFAFVAGRAMSTATSVAAPDTAPGATADFSVAMTAPTTPGSHQSFWELRNPAGARIGPQVWALIRVTAGPAQAPPLVTSPGPLSGLTVAAVQLNPPQATFQDQIGFRVTFNNTGGTEQSLQWFVKLYQCPLPCDDLQLREVLVDLNRSFGETPVVESVLPAGVTQAETVQQWTPGAGACSYVAVPHAIEPVGQGIAPILKSDGIPLYHRFEVC
ncbi:MAG: hypothetical protein HY782_04575 [Chloroflexi bacterium]|nr:hypothetical protein [Chloroflexota bacterium]